MKVSVIDHSFLDYWNACESALLRLYGVDLMGTGIEAGCIADAQDAGWTPEAFAKWYGEKYALVELP